MWIGAEKSRGRNLRPTLSGFIYIPRGYPEASQYVEKVGYAPLTPEDYLRGTNGQTYAIGLTGPLHYRLVANATLGIPCLSASWHLSSGS
jgi:hypothetical protein